MELSNKYNLINDETGLPMGYLVCSCRRLFKQAEPNQIYCVECRAKGYIKKKGKNDTKMYEDYVREDD